MMIHPGVRAGTRVPRFRLLAVMVGALTLLTATVPFVPPASAADPASDIPGIDLPGSIAAGRLGGTIYDVVYRLPVPAGYVIVAGLTGTPGTDFDLYLFDASATTVLSKTGLLMESTGATSTESISWPSRLGGVYYIDLNGSTDVEGDYRLTVQTVPDSTPPLVSIALAAGRASTNQLTVPVTLTATEDLSGIAEMAFSTDGVTFGEWQAYASATTWTFPSGDGARTLWAKVRNGVGLESAIASDSVTIDTSPPSVVALDPAPGSSVVGLRPTFRASFNEAINPATWSDLGLVVQSPTGSLVTGTYTYDAKSQVGSFVPATDLLAGGLYVVNVGQIRDVAGNDVAKLASWTITPLSPTTFKADASPKVLVIGGSTRISVRLEGVSSPTSLEMLSSNSSGGFEPVSSFDLVDGQLSLLAAPVRNMTYRFRYAGAFGIAPAQVDVPVLVRRSVVLTGRNAAVVASSKVGATVTLTATIGPALPAVAVSFRLYRFDAVHRTWVYAGSRGRRTDLNGRATYAWAPASAGSYYWRVSVASSPEFANNTSSVYRWSISR